MTSGLLFYNLSPFSRPTPPPLIFFSFRLFLALAFIFALQNRTVLDLFPGLDQTEHLEDEVGSSEGGVAGGIVGRTDLHEVAAHDVEAAAASEMEAEAAAFSKWTLFTYYLFEKFLAYLHFIKVTKSLVMFTMMIHLFYISIRKYLLICHSSNIGQYYVFIEYCSTIT